MLQPYADSFAASMTEYGRLGKYLKAMLGILEEVSPSVAATFRRARDRLVEFSRFLSQYSWATQARPHTQIEKSQRYRL